MKKILAAVGLIVAFLGVSGEIWAMMGIGAALMLPLIIGKADEE